MSVKFSPLKKERDIQAVFVERRRVSNKNFVLYYTCKLNGEVRAAFFVPKKVFKRAWDRNRVRRILREIFRNYNWNNRGLDIVCIVKTLESKTLNLKEIKSVFLPLLKDLV